MLPAKDKTIEAGLPRITILIVGSALLIALFPGAAQWLIYDRAAILHGEVWRLISGNLVHFSRSHLIYDTLAFAVAGWMIESQEPRRFRALCLTAPVAIGVAVFLFQPQFSYFGGLSGMAFGGVALLLSCEERPGRSWRITRGVFGFLFILRILADLILPGPLLARFDGMEVVSSSASHIAGVVFGIVLTLLVK